ncbi:MAG: hypothetical protein ACRDPN_06790 [Aeromicrobium sp.]
MDWGPFLGARQVQIAGLIFQNLLANPLASPDFVVVSSGASMFASRAAFLDINHQVELLDLLTDPNLSRGTTIVVVMHDLNLACRYADHVIAMKHGSIAAEGAPRGRRHAEHPLLTRQD